MNNAPGASALGSTGAYVCSHGSGSRKERNASAAIVSSAMLLETSTTGRSSSSVSKTSIVF